MGTLDDFGDCWMCADDGMEFGYAPDGDGELCPICEGIVHAPAPVQGVPEP